MKRSVAIFWLLFLFAAVSTAGQSVKLITKTSEKRVDVEVDGKLFTSYRWDERIKRPALYPIIAANGAYVTRGFPFETRDGETIDHPHQVGFSLSYGNVNDVDFWNSSTFRTAKEMEKMGAIVHQRILKATSGKGRGELITQSVWVMSNGKTILYETTRYVFQASHKNRWLDRDTTLTANDEDVVFGDSKEGMIGLHLATELEQEDQIGVKITSRDGVISERKADAGNVGKYINSEGLVGAKVWGTLGKWAMVSGKIRGEEVFVILKDLSNNPDLQSYLMVRGYGLLALNLSAERLLTLKKKKESLFWGLEKRSNSSTS